MKLQVLLEAQRNVKSHVLFKDSGKVFIQASKSGFGWYDETGWYVQFFIHHKGDSIHPDGPPLETEFLLVGKNYSQSNITRLIKGLTTRCKKLGSIEGVDQLLAGLSDDDDDVANANFKELTDMIIKETPA